MAFKYPARLKAQAEAWKIKARKSEAKEKQLPVYPTSEEEPAIYAVLEEEPAIGSDEMELDTAVTWWTRNSEQQSSELSSFEDNMPESTPILW